MMTTVIFRKSGELPWVSLGLPASWMKLRKGVFWEASP